MLGAVKFWKGEQGWGFITGEDGKEYFVHYRDITGDSSPKNLTPGQKVSFLAVPGPKGVSAKGVEALGNTI